MVIGLNLFGRFHQNGDAKLIIFLPQFKPMWINTTVSILHQALSINRILHSFERRLREYIESI